MKKVIMSFFAALVPTVCLGLDDACTKPDEFTIDKRCYVTDEEKQMSPYNTVVGLVPNWSNTPYCTGTIVEDIVAGQRKKRVYTAKHCTDIDDNFEPDIRLIAKGQGGLSYSLILDDSGNYDIKRDCGFSGDWAIYTINSNLDNIPYTELTNNRCSAGGSNFDARVVGYGALKIMSNVEIANFKNSYINFLDKHLEDIAKSNVDQYRNDRKARGFTDDGAVDYSNPIVKLFVMGGNMYDNALSQAERTAIFKDNDKLKVSRCQLSSDGYRQGCQSWTGNSGGPIFDEDGRLMGIMTRSHLLIGGANHAGGDYQSPTNADGVSGLEQSDGRPDTNIHFLQQ